MRRRTPISVARVTRDRVAPIVLTALTMALPPSCRCCSSVASPGPRCSIPFAVVVLGGLVTSTVLTVLIVLPAVPVVPGGRGTVRSAPAAAPAQAAPTVPSDLTEGVACDAPPNPLAGLDRRSRRSRPRRLQFERTGEEVPEENPHTSKPIEGSERRPVTLTKDGAEPDRYEDRAGAASPATGTVTSPQSVIPLAAVLYDKDGKPGSTPTRRRSTFVRQRVVIDRVDGDSACSARDRRPAPR